MRRTGVWGWIGVWLCLLVGASAALGADQKNTPEERERRQLVDAIASRIGAGYVLPDIARQLEAGLRSRAEKHEYDSVRTTEELCDRITRDLRQINHDLHLAVLYQPEVGTPGQALNGLGRTVSQQDQAGRLSNYGFESVGRLPGNVGYLDLREFYATGGAYETAAAAMAFLSHTDALILDLRSNNGGAAEMNALLSTYLLGRKLTLLNRIRGREADQVGELWTMPLAPRLVYENEVYLLTSRDTFSQAEAFAYQLQQLKRATVVGERTAGGAHLVTFERISEHVVLRLPRGRFVHPITDTNWQGTGVLPDVEAPAADALERAFLLALTSLQRKNTNPELAPVFERLIKQAQQSTSSQARSTATAPSK